VRRMRTRLATLLAVGLLAGLAGSACAYFSSTGIGEAAASVSLLSAPKISAATPAAGGTVALTWTPVAPPGSGGVSYYVKRDGGSPAGNCPSSAAPQVTTSCTDAGLAPGTHTYTVTAVWHTWSATSPSSSAEVTTGAAANFTIAAATTTPTAGAADNLTITAKDSAGNTVTSYTGSHSLTFSGASPSPGGTAATVANSAGTAIAFGAAAAISFSSGVASVSSGANGVLKVYRAGAASISVTDGSISSATPLALVVGPSAASSFSLAATTTTPTAGAADNLTITALDAYGNTATAYTGSHSLVFSGASKSPGGTAPTVSSATGAETAFGTATALTFAAGVAAASGTSNGAMKLYKSGATSVKATEGSITTPTALPLTVSAGSAAKLGLAAATTTPTAGAADNLTITALDAYGNTATSYTGSHNLVFAGASKSPSGESATVVNSAGTAVPFGTATALSFTAGVASVAGSKNGVLKLVKVETASLSASEGALSTAAPLSFTVAAGTAARLGFVSLTQSAGSLAANCLFACTVTGVGNSGTVSAKVAVTDAAGNTVSAVGSGHTVAVTTTGGTVTGGALTIAATGAAISSASFTYTAKSSGAFTDTITAATSAGTAYTSATISVSR
jgi:hypothetical protein